MPSPSLLRSVHHLAPLAHSRASPRTSLPTVPIDVSSVGLPRTPPGPQLTPTSSCTGGSTTASRPGRRSGCAALRCAALHRGAGHVKREREVCT
ncbi:uncharacterized protein BKA78DRAFT_325597 [Phyllosticta capitalensis]|uniref:uncharacterized protein n=1 Tax=Phyllosticta capitalensis TaxID=121624 RepID=UPI003131BE58